MEALTTFFRRAGRMPSFSEAADILGLRSKGAAFKVIAKLQASGAVRKASPVKSKSPPMRPCRRTRASPTACSRS